MMTDIKSALESVDTFALVVVFVATYIICGAVIYVRDDEFRAFAKQSQRLKVLDFILFGNAWRLKDKISRYLVYAVRISAVSVSVLGVVVIFVAPRLPG